MKILSWDIEASGLNADFAIVLCVGFKVVGEGTPKVLNILDYRGEDQDLIRAEKRLLVDVSKRLLDADVWLTHYGCPTPDQRILKQDLSWASAGDLKVGDAIIGFDAEAAAGQRRHWTPATVVQALPMRKPVVRVTFSDGSTTQVTDDHPFLTYQYVYPSQENHLVWKHAGLLGVGDRLPKYFTPWHEDTSRDGGYLAGFFDGEGTLGQSARQAGRSGHSLNVTATQQCGIVLDRVQRILREKQIPYTLNTYDPTQSHMRAICIGGGVARQLKFLGSIRPIRILSRFDAAKLYALNRETVVTVVAMESLGEQDVIALGTTSQTYVSEGFASHNTWFDVPFMNTRLLYHHLPILPPNYAHIDTWKISRNRLKLRSNRLVTISGFLNTKDEKNAIKPEQWLRALGGHRGSMGYIVSHCKRDVLVLEEVYQRLKPLVLDHPNKGLVDGHGGCGVCGSTRMQARGFHITRTRKYQRRQCTSCGSWSKDPTPIEVRR